MTLDCNGRSYGQGSFLFTLHIAPFTESCYTESIYLQEDAIMTRVEGKPADISGRLEKERRVYDFLDNLNISYRQVDHEPAMTMEACLAVDKALGAAMCKNLLLCNRQNTAFYLLMMPGDKSFRTKDLSKQIGSSRLSFADGAYMEQFLDITPGSLSVLGLMNDTDKRVQLIIDEDVLKDEYIGCHPCINTSSLRIRTEDLMQKIIPAMNHAPILVTLE